MTVNRQSKIEVGDIVVTRGGIGGPSMRVLAFSYVDQGACVGVAAKLASVRPDDEDPSQPAWTAEILISDLRWLPPDHYSTRSPFYDLGVDGHVEPTFERPQEV